jgi:predicted P-loop ATPase
MADNPKYDDKFIADLKARVSLAGLIGSHVVLSKDGADLKGLCPFHKEKTPSFTVYDDHYNCYGCGANGDHIEWLQQAERLTFPQAVEKLSGMAGVSAPSGTPPRARAPEPTIGRPPENTPPPTCILNGAKPTILTPYRDAHGLALFYVARHDTDNGKIIRPWSWDAEKRAWASAGYPYPRPVVGLPQIMAEPEKPILLVEGEKTREAAMKIAGRVYHVTTWCGGAQAIKKTDFSTLFRRKILIWPDADRHLIKTEADAEKHGLKIGDILPYDYQPGPSAMRQIAAILGPNCPDIKMLEVGIDTSRADGWDAADALADGMDWTKFVAWAKPLAKPWKGAKVVNLGQEREERKNAAGAAGDAPRSERAGGRAVTLEAKWDETGLQLNTTGTPVANMDNAVRVLERWPDFKDAFWYDEFSNRVYTTWDCEEKEWDDHDTLRLTLFLQRDFGIRLLKDTAANAAMILMAKKNTINAPRQWMESLTWDGRPRILSFFTNALGADASEYTESASMNFWISLAARIFQPGCKADNMVILEGMQGIQKSSALFEIGGDWFAESGTSITDKDFFQQLPGKMLIEIAELDSFSKADHKRIKGVLSRRVDRYRPSYGRHSMDFLRQCIFVGSTNEHKYLEDATGGRRFFPIRCGKIDLEMIKRDRDQLFAEAVARFKSGETWWEMPEQETKAIQESRREKDEWESLISNHMSLQTSSFITMSDIARDALGLKPERLDKPTQRRIAQAIRGAGWASDTEGRWTREQK